MIPMAHVIFVLDNSGSMSSYASATANAFNVLLDTLQQVKGAVVKLTLLTYGGSDRPEIKIVYKARHIQDAKPLKNLLEICNPYGMPTDGGLGYGGRGDPKEYHRLLPILGNPDGAEAQASAVLPYMPNASLDCPYDAMLRAVKLGEEKEFAGCKTVVCLLCDGGDNSSRSASSTVQLTLEKKRAEGWEFNYLACGVSMGEGNKPYGEPIEIAKRMGIPPSHLVTYGKGKDGKADAAFRETALAAAAYVTGRAKDTAYGKKEVA